MSCKKCFKFYNNSSKKPIKLPCDHDICLPCFENTTSISITCPNCQSRHRIPHGYHLEVSYDVLFNTKRHQKLNSIPISQLQFDYNITDITTACNTTGFTIDQEGVVIKTGRREHELPKPCLIACCGAEPLLVIDGENEELVATIPIKAENLDFTFLTIWEQDQKIILSDQGSNCVFIVSFNGEITGRSKQGLLNVPMGLEVISKGRHLAVCDTAGRSVLILSLPDLQLQQQILSPDDLHLPYSLTEIQDHLYIISRCADNNTIGQLYKHAIGGEYPVEDGPIAVEQNKNPFKLKSWLGRLFLSGNHNVAQINEKDGSFIQKIGAFGYSERLLNLPGGFTFYQLPNMEYRLAVCDTANQRIKFHQFK